MPEQPWTRRRLLAAGAIASCLPPTSTAATGAETGSAEKRGHQRLSLEQIGRWESLHYGMFIHFGINTFLEEELPRERVSPAVYAPDRLDVDQWASVARDAGMKYAVLTAKHVTGHCLWPSRQTDYTVARSGNRTDVMSEFVEACRKRGVQPGFYYSAWDNGHRFGGKTHSDPGYGVFVKPPDFTQVREGMVIHPDKPAYLCAYTSSLYQDFVTAQIAELLTDYGPIAEVWIDIPGVLGRGYRTFLYQHITTLQPEAVVVANHGMNNGAAFREAYAWPCDAISMEQNLPPEAGHDKWRTIQGREYCIPGECCITLGETWFYTPKDKPKPQSELVRLYEGCRNRGANLLLNVPPDKHGLIQQPYIDALGALGKTVGA